MNCLDIFICYNQIINNYDLLRFEFICIYLFIFGLLGIYLTKENKYIVMIESNHKKKVFTKKPMLYKDALESIQNLEYQLKCQNTFGFKKMYNIYILKYDKINQILVDYKI